MGFDRGTCGLLALGCALAACAPEPRGLTFTLRDASGAVLETSTDPWLTRDFGQQGSRRAVWSGSLWVPRGGPTGLTILGPDPSLSVDGVPVTLQDGSARLLLRSGRHQIEMGARAEGRVALSWNPVGRPFVPEPLPPGWTSPDDARPGMPAYPWELQRLSQILGVLCCAFLVLLWAFRKSLRTALPLAGVMALSAIPRLASFQEAGATWDEDTYYSAGLELMVPLLRLETPWVNSNPEHPSVTKLLAGLGAMTTDDLGGARWPFVVLSVLLVGLVVLVSRELFGGDGIWAGIMAALCPPLIAYGRIIGHEGPTLFLWALAALAILRVDRAKWAVVPAGVALGLAIGTRFSNLLLAVASGLVLASRRRWQALVWTIGLAVMTVLLVWPALWTHPVDAWVQALTRLREMESARLRYDGAHEWFLGAFSADFPPTYLPVYLVASTPPVMSFFWFLGLVTVPAKIRWYLVGWTGLPLLIDTLGSMQDGIRYAIPSILGIVLGAGAGIQALKDRWQTRLGKTVPWMVLLGSAGSLHSAWPYPLDYASLLVGGPEYAQKARWLDFGGMGEGVGECLHWFDLRAPKGSKVAVEVVPAHIVRLREDLLWVDLEQAEYLIENRALGPPPEGFRVLHEERAGGALLARVSARPGAPTLSD